MPIHLFICMPACLSICLPACLSVCLPACLSVCLPVSLSVCLPAWPSLGDHVSSVLLSAFACLTLLSLAVFLQCYAICFTCWVPVGLAVLHHSSRSATFKFEDLSVVGAYLVNVAVKQPSSHCRDLDTAQRLWEETNSQIQKALASQTM